MKTLLSTLILGGSLVLGGCGEKEFTGKIIKFNENFKETGWNIYCLTNNKDTLLVGTKNFVNPFDKGDSVKINYQFIEGVDISWDQKENSGQLKENEYTMNQLLGYQILKKHENEKSELEKYNLENKQVYDDFVDFFKEKKDNDGFYFNKKPEVAVQLKEDYIWIYGEIEGKDRRFNDYGFNGMDSLDLYKNETGKKEFIQNMPPEKQFSVAKEYTSLLKEILHEEKYKNY